MDKITIKFDDTEIEEYEFHQFKRPILTNDIGINNIVAISFLLVSKILNILLVTKMIKKLYFYAYSVQNSIQSIYRKDFDESKCMYFFIIDEKFFNKYNGIWEKISNIT